MFGPRSGDVLGGRFRIDKLLGQGGFGAVYAATQLNLDREVALKILRPDLIATEDSRARFRREAELAQRLEHPNTVRLFDFGGVEEGVPFMAFELLHGRGLDEVIAHDGPQAEARVARMTSQVLKSLMEAHGKGIVHRDIKPSNIFLCDFPGEPDFAKVLDFGIAKLAHGDASTVTSDGQVLGSPSYMAPEQVRGSAVEPSSDLYALGLVAAEMLSGQLVYRGPSALQVLMDQASDAPVPLSAHVLSSPLGAVIERATRKCQDERFRSAEEMLRALESSIRTASEHPAAFDATLQLVEIPRGMPYAQTTPASPAASTTMGAAIVDGSTTDSQAIHIARPKLGWIIAFAAVGTAILAGVGGGVGVVLLQRTDAGSASAAPTKREKGIDLAETNPFTRGRAFKNLDVARIRSRAEQAGWRVNDTPRTTVEGDHTVVTMVLFKDTQTAIVTLSIHDRENTAKAVFDAALSQEDTSALLDGTGVFLVTVPGDPDLAKRLLKVLSSNS